MFNHRTHLTFSAIFLILALCLSLANTSTAFADDGTPTDVPTAEATDTPTDVPAVETTDAPTDIPVITITDTALQETPEAVATVPPEEIPATSAPEQPSADQLLAQMPENTDVVVINSDGETVPLAAQEAAEIVQGADPTWCPDGAVPGDASCRLFTSLPTSDQNLTALIDDMRTNPGSYSSGTIYLEDPSGVGFTTPLILDDSASSLSTSFDVLKTINLGIVGGWVPATNGFSGDTHFGLNGANQGYISVGSASNPWVGNIRIQDVIVTGNTTANPSVSVFTSTGSVSFNDVDVHDAQNASSILVSTISGDVSLIESDIVNGSNNNGIAVTTTSGNINFESDDVRGQQDGHTASLSTQTGNIDISNGSAFNGINDNLGFAATSLSGSISITGTSTDPIAFKDARGAGDGTNNNGATLSAPIVTLSYVIAANNDGHGIAISNADVVTLNNVNATANGTDIGSSGNADNNNVGSGVYVNGNPGSTVIVNSGVFRRNQRYGIEVINGTIYVRVNPICGAGTNANDSGCYSAFPIFDDTPPIITFLSRTPANGNGWNNTDVVLTWSCTDAESGVFSSTVSQTVSGEGTNQSATGTCTNHVGLTASDTQSGINIDKTGPTLNLPASISVGTALPTGATVNYVAGATDNLDPSVSADCSPLPGTNFPVGTTAVNCSSTDQAGNRTSGSFNVTVSDSTMTPPITTGGTVSSTGIGEDVDLFVPVTGGNTIDIACNPPDVFQVQSGDLRLTFNNLCGYQAFFENLVGEALPGVLAADMSFLSGFTIQVMKDGKAVQPLPKDASILIEFELPADQQSTEYGAFEWNGNEWVEVLGEKTADGYFSITAGEGGTYIIVMK